jgi:hypothetical protein
VELTAKPKDFIKKDLINTILFDEEKLEKKSKYFKYYNELFSILINKMKEKNELSLKGSEVINYLDEITIEINENLVKETCDIVDCKKKDLLQKIEKNNSDYYSFFSLTNNEVDNLLLEASSKETFEEAANLILQNLKNDYDKNLTNNNIKDLLYKLKKKYFLPS